jgi:hypothetical protein
MAGLARSFPLARRAVGLALGAALAATTLLLLGAAPARAAQAPVLAVDPLGTASFAWVRFDGANTLVQERFRSAAGVLSDGQYLSAAGQEVGGPRVAVDGDGDAYFVWSRGNVDEGSDARVQARKRSPDGSLSAVQTLSAAGQSADEQQVGVDSDGNAYFVWVRFDGTNRRVQMRRRAADGTLGSVQNLSAAGQHANSPQVAVTPNGIAHFVWERSDGSNRIVQTRRRTSAGLSAVQDLSEAGQDAFVPQVAVDPNDNAYFVWARFDGSGVVCCVRAQTRVRSVGGALSAVQNLSSGGQGAIGPQVGVDPDGIAYFTWLSSGGADQRAQMRRRAADGTLGSVQNLSAVGQNAVDPQVAVAPDGVAHFVWRRHDGSSISCCRIVQTRRRTSAGLSAVQDLSAAGGEAASPGVAVDPSSNSTFVWERAGVIQTRRRTAAGSLGATVDLSN